VLNSCQDRIFDNPFDPDAGEVVFEVINTIPTPALIPLGLAWDGSTIWNVDGFNETLYSLNRLNGAQVRSLTSVLQVTSGIACDGYDLWVCSEALVEIYKINLLTGDIQKRLNLQRGSFTAIEYGNDGLWIADAQSNKVLRVDPDTAEIISSFMNPGTRVDGMAFDGAYLWVSDMATLTIFQMTLEGDVLRSYLSPGQSPRGLTYDGVFLWNADGNRRIYQLKFQN
jgi:hypothetical protein